MVDDTKDSMAQPAPKAEAPVALPEVPAVEVTPSAQPLAETESKPGRARKEMVPAPVVQPAAVKTDAPVPAPVVTKAVTPVAAPTPAKPAKVKPVAKAPAKKVTKAPAAKPPVAAAPAPAVKPAFKRPATATPSVKPVTAAAAKVSAPRKELFAMATTTEFTDKMTAAFKDAQDKAKAAFGDAGAFAKGNVEAVVESSKILASGIQEMSKGYVAETKSAFEAMTADVKELTTVKSPTEFFEKQSALMRKNFDAAVAASSKNSEAMLKLANEAFQPISTRVSLAVEKIKKAA
jgi:phasin family protein